MQCKCNIFATNATFTGVALELLSKFFGYFFENQIVDLLKTVLGCQSPTGKGGMGVRFCCNNGYKKKDMCAGYLEKRLAGIISVFLIL
jgi:hypothetical protein